MAVRLAALDIGSTSVHITVARVLTRHAMIQRLADETDLVRLGVDVHHRGVIGPERMERACAAIAQQVRLARYCGAESVLAVATHAVRAATNRAELVERVLEATGIQIELISGEQEAALTYWGAVSDLKRSRRRRLVIDMGGGSLELATGVGPRIRWRTSLPFGSGAVREQFLGADPPDEPQLAAARQALREQMRALPHIAAVERAIVCGGTATTLAALAALPTCEHDGHRDDIDDGIPITRIRRLSRRQIERALRRSVQVPAVQMAQELGTDEGRARVLPSGALILLATMDWMGVDSLRVRRRGLREGAMLAYALMGSRWLAAAAAGELDLASWRRAQAAMTTRPMPRS